ncbi:MAG: adenosylmethionine--8-amino-7-oxononanoate transaminase [Hyphomicrobiaceae bacterium]|nr:adenosylmethionine--8-amino-7-oxononanoate transaminase [Hyphomicrobiaceae bacterium]
MTSDRGSPVWHPFTQHALQPEATMIARGAGAVLETPDGRRIIDAISSWWVVTHGHRHPTIVEAIHRQIDILDQVIFAGFTHEPAEELAARLIQLAPAGLAHVFYSDSGSTAVEVAIKMALGYWHNTGGKRHRILALEHAYHGDTVGAMSAGARGVFTEAYAPLLFEVVRVPFPSADDAQSTLDAIEAACAAGDVAALLVEPLILGAGGMRIYSAETLAEMVRVARHHGALVIADEVMTGWGRTGALFASTQAGITPDILCTAKGLTGGSIPLAATLATAAIFDAHVSSDRRRTFFHSSSYTANPIACAAGLANCNVWREEPVMERIDLLQTAQEAHIAPFRDDADFANVRRIGTITALDLVVPDNGYLAEIGPKLYAFFANRDVLLRPLGNTIYVMPPYCIEDDDLDHIYRTIRDAADACI